MRSHRLGLRAPVHAAEFVADDGVSADDVVAVLVTDRHTMTTIPLQPVVLGHTPAHPPAEEETVFAIRDSATVSHRWPLRPATGMQPKSGTAFDDAAIHLDVARLLEADAVAVAVPYEAIPYQAMVAAIEKNTGGAASVHDSGILSAIAVDNEVFHTGVLECVAADNRKDRGRKTPIAHQDVRVHGTGECEVVAPRVEDRSAHTEEVAMGSRRHIHPAADVEALRMLHRDRRLAEVAIGSQR